MPINHQKKNKMAGDRNLLFYNLWKERRGLLFPHISNVVVFSKAPRTKRNTGSSVGAAVGGVFTVIIVIAIVVVAVIYYLR